MNAQIEDWIKKIETIQLPRWDDLPNLSLYLDQVLEYVNDHIGIVFINHDESQDKILTSSMINNYVKNQIMPAPNRKRYDKNHIAFIITITVLKQVSNLNDISNGINHLTSVLGKVDAYNSFVTFLENALKASIQEFRQAESIKYFETPVEMNLLPLKTATVAFASMMMSKYLMKHLTNLKGEK